MRLSACRCAKDAPALLRLPERDFRAGARQGTRQHGPQL